MGLSTGDRSTNRTGRDMDTVYLSGLMEGNIKATGATLRERAEASSDMLKETSMMVRYY